MLNEKNLIPFNERTESEQREICSAGGRASGAARRRKKSLKEAADLFLSLPVADTKTWNAMSKAGVEPEDIDNQMMIIMGLTKKAAKGDAKAAKALFELVGPVDDSNGKADKSGSNMQSLADILRNPVPDRNIEDFEE